MATVVNRGPRHWQAKVRRKGVTASATFETKTRAEAWARQIEADIDAQRFQPGRIEAERTTLAEALARYLKERVPLKAGVKQNAGIIRGWRRSSLAPRSLVSIRSAEIAAFRDEMLTRVGAQTVMHHLNLLSNLYSIAASEWGMESLSNPVKKVRKPQLPNGRDRRLQSLEEAKLLGACDQSRSRWLGAMVRLALHSAMRQGELVGLHWSDIKLDRRTILLRETKNGTSRTVPLSSGAAEVLESLPRSKTGKVFPVAEGRAVSHAFLKACRVAELEDLRFHDLRHEATSRLFERTDLRDIEIASITGHRTMEMLKRYAHLRATSLAERLG